jgi:hypothetical protein
MWRGEGDGEGEDDKIKNEEKKRLEQMSAQLSAKEFERFCFYVMSIVRCRRVSDDVIDHQESAPVRKADAAQRPPRRAVL